MHQVHQQGDGNERRNQIGVHYLPPAVMRAQPAAKAQVSAKKSAIAPIYIASISSSCSACFDNDSVCPGA
ncbi:MAG: hypothetical protein ACJ8HI_12115 [Massilia sp.]